MRIRFAHVALAALFFLALWFGLLAANGGAAAFFPHLAKFLKAMVCVSSTWVLGSILLRESAPEGGAGVLIRFTAGLIAVYYLMFLLGILHAYHPLLLVGLLYAPTLLALPWLVRSGKIAMMRGIEFELQRWQLAILILGSFALFYCFLISQTPVIHYDALTNHLAIPAEYLARGGIEAIPYNMHANLPPASHMIYALLIAGAGGDTIPLFHLLVAVFIAIAFVSLVQEGPTFGWLLGWLLFVSIPQVSLLFSLVDIDFLVTLFCFAVLVLYRLTAESMGRRGLLLLAAHLAFLCSLKYQSVVFVSLVVALLGLRLYRTGESVRRFVLMVLLLLALVAPFLAKNLAYTGDPVFPFLSGIFTIQSSTPEETAGFIGAASHLSGPLRAGEYFRTLLYLYTRQPEAGMLLALVAFAAVFYWKTKHQAAALLAFFAAVPVLISSVFSANVVNLMRWIHYSWAALCLLAGVCAQQKRLRTLLLVVCIMASFGIGFMFNLRLTSSLLVGTGKMSDEQYRLAFIPSFALRKKMALLPPRILFIGDTRGFYNVENSVIPSVYNYLYISKYFESAGTPRQLRQNLQKDGIHYLYLNTGEIRKLLGNGRYRWLEGKNLSLLQQLVAQSRLVAREDASLLVQL